MSTKKRLKPRYGFIVAAVSLTIVSALVTYIVRLISAFNNFRKVNHLPDEQYDILGWTYSEPAQVSIKDLPNGTYFWGVLFFSLIMLFVYPLCGKLFAKITVILEQQFIAIYNIDPNEDELPWQGGIEEFEFGAIWPISILYTIFLMIADLVGGIYRMIWPKF